MLRSIGLDTKCANGQNRDFATLVSNMPTGDLTYLDAGYDLTVTNTGKGKGKNADLGPSQ